MYMQNKNKSMFIKLHKFVYTGVFEAFLASGSKLQDHNVHCEEVPAEEDPDTRTRNSNCQSWLYLYLNLLILCFMVPSACKFYIVTHIF